MKRKFEHRVKFSMCVRVASFLNSKHSFTGEFKSPRNFHPISYFPLSFHPNTSSPLPFVISICDPYARVTSQIYPDDRN